jgi:hypothetical protein
LVNLVAPALHCTKIVFAFGPAKSKIEKKKVKKKKFSYFAFFSVWTEQVSVSLF